MIDDMITDFINRSKSRYTADQVKQALADNLSIVNEDGFICFSIVQDECYTLFAYVRPGVSFKPFQYAVELFAKTKGCKTSNFVTYREKAFARKFKDYRPGPRLFQKNL